MVDTLYITSRYIAYYIIIYYMQHMCGIINHHILTLGWPVMGISTHVLFTMAPPRTCWRSYRTGLLALLCRRICVGSAAVFWGTYNCCGGIGNAGCDLYVALCSLEDGKTHNVGLHHFTMSQVIKTAWAKNCMWNAQRVTNLLAVVLFLRTSVCWSPFGFVWK